MGRHRTSPLKWTKIQVGGIGRHASPITPSHPKKSPKVLKTIEQINFGMLNFVSMKTLNFEMLSDGHVVDDDDGGADDDGDDDDDDDDDDDESENDNDDVDDRNGN